MCRRNANKILKLQPKTKEDKKLIQINYLKELGEEYQKLKEYQKVAEIHKKVANLYLQLNKQEYKKDCEFYKTWSKQDKAWQKVKERKLKEAAKIFEQNVSEFKKLQKQYNLKRTKTDALQSEAYYHFFNSAITHKRAELLKAIILSAKAYVLGDSHQKIAAKHFILKSAYFIYNFQRLSMG